MSATSSALTASTTALPNKAVRQPDRGLFFLLRISALLSAVLLLLITGFIAFESTDALQSLGTRLVSDNGWYPSSTPNGQFNLLPMIAGSLLVALLALIMALPLALGSVLFVHAQNQQWPWLQTLYRRLLELLAGVPSVVFGLWGLVVIVPILTTLQPPGASLLAGALVLALMILPTIALLADGALSTVPASLRLGGLALGMSNWRVATKIMLPQAKAGVLAGAILGLGRALGETMVVLMVCGNVVQLPDSLLTPIRTLTANIALEMAYATGTQRSTLFVSGLLLTLLVMALVWAAHYYAKPKPIKPTSRMPRKVQT